MSLDAIFTRSTDGLDCPKADCYAPEVFEAMCRKAGFEQVEFAGGYPNALERGCLQKYLEPALADPRLEEEHKVFLRGIKADAQGDPMREGKYAAIGGVYYLA